MDIAPSDASQEPSCENTQAELFQDLMGRGVTLCSGYNDEEADDLFEEVLSKYLPPEHAARKQCLKNLRDTLLRVIGEFEAERDRVSRGAALKRLGELADALSTAEQILGSAARNGLHDDRDVASVNLLVIAGAHEAPAVDQRAQLGRDVEAIARLRARCAKGIALAKATKDRTGRPRVNWYRRWVDLMVWMANQLNIKVTTQGNRSDNPADTPFVRMVFDFEKLLPRVMRVNSLKGCHQRLMRSASPALKKHAKTRSKK
jgi:hypothetical protein